MNDPERCAMCGYLETQHGPYGSPGWEPHRFVSPTEAGP